MAITDIIDYVADDAVYGAVYMANYRVVRLEVDNAVYSAVNSAIRNITIDAVRNVVKEENSNGR
jgi:hypothetical protein